MPSKRFMIPISNDGSAFADPGIPDDSHRAGRSQSDWLLSVECQDGQNSMTEALRSARLQWTMKA